MKKSTPVNKKKVKKFPVVAIGASLGGLQAVSTLLKHLPGKTGMAYIYVQHLSPTHKSMLVEILARKTKMKVQEIDDMELMKPNNLYVIPHDRGIQVTNGHIKLIPRSKATVAVSIDVLFASLALTHKENVIGIVLSGNATDGTEGLKAIKEAGGFTMAQDATAQAASMPRSAIASGVVDLVLSPKRMAMELGQWRKRRPLKAGKKKAKKKIIVDEKDENLKNIFGQIEKKTGIDFSHYKTASIKRRLFHRMQQVGIGPVSEYASYVLKNSNEIDLLGRELLINVTSFFRDGTVFNYVKSHVFPKLLRSKKSGETLRIWVPACSTGQEAYSLAIILAELQEKNDSNVPVQIFATDLSEQAIRKARAGEYSVHEMHSVSPERIKAFFTKTGDLYRINKEVREMCVFAPHNLLTDPPFFKIDFISCRNLLIYLDTVAQKRALATMHFAARDHGLLMLGNSESIGTSAHFFSQTNNRYKIYSRRKEAGARKVPDLSPRVPGTALVKRMQRPLKTAAINATELDNAMDTFLLSHHMPACVIINKDMEILQFRGSTSHYLTHAHGKASLNILKMVRPEFDLELRNAINAALKTNQKVRKSGIEIKIGGIMQSMSVEVSPLKIEWDEPLLMVVFAFQEQVNRFDEKKGGKKGKKDKEREVRIKKLMDELSSARTEMQAVVLSQESAYEELQAANEEVVSTNEEFQTLNEELETSKEEVEATNEELISTNQELKIQNELLAESYNYSQTIIATIHEPMIVLDRNLHVKSANKSFYKKFHVNSRDTEGTLLFELGNNQWDIPKLRELLQDILSRNVDFHDFEVVHTFPGIGEKVMLLNAHRIVQKAHREQLILLAIEDITERAHHYLKEKEYLKMDIQSHQQEKLELEKAVRRRTRQLEQKNVELESANKDLTTFTYVSSHDLQEPLRKIQNFVAYILKKEEQNLSSNGKVYFQRMQETAKRMQALIEDLLTYSRTKTTERNFEKIDLQVILDETRTDFEEIIAKKKAVIKGVDLCAVNVIPFQFRQLMHNLVGNSLKFSKPGKAPRITIKCRVEKGSKLNIEKLSAKLKYFHIIYTDNGIGFDPQYQTRIFEVFQRLHSYEEYKGTGIGLAICKRIVENHKGAITATGKLGKGARFDIYFPA